MKKKLAEQRALYRKNLTPFSKAKESSTTPFLMNKETLWTSESGTTLDS